MKDNFKYDSYKDSEIAQFIGDERILRSLFISKIFKLRSIQKRAIKAGLFFRKSFLVSAPSGSGKTLIGELCAINNVFQGFGKSIYLVPFKALATEKFFHFKKSYSKYGISIELSIGDHEINEDKLEHADLIITTYEKLDSILRNFKDEDWLQKLSTIIIDEIHIIGDYSRGPRLESLIVRLNEFLSHPQIIGLSATIANPNFFNSWLSSLGNQSILIKSDDRPVPLNYNIETTQSKDSTIKKKVKYTLEKGGQVMIFLSTRKQTLQGAINLMDQVEKHLEVKEKEDLMKASAKIKRIKGHNKELAKVLKSGVSFHHAGLLSQERKIVEDVYKARIVKVICCTTTLSAGVNLPARLVILKSFKKFSTSGTNIKNFKGFRENEDGFTYYKPFDSNEVFQMLGRAGRPGLDKVGYGVILAKSVDEMHTAEDLYFQPLELGYTFVPKYNDLTSSLNNVNMLKEQVLLRIFEENEITLPKLIRFFEKTYFWHVIKNKVKKKAIPIDQLLMIKEISPINILKLHSNPQKLRELKEKVYSIKISNLSSMNITGYIKTDYGVHHCKFDIDTGIQCSCGFENGISDNYVNQEFSFELCDHVSVFLIYLIQLPDKNFKKYVNDIVPKAVKNQYILNYLIDKGLIEILEGGKFRCSHFGQLIIKCYLHPVSGVIIRNKLENVDIETQQDIIKEAFNVLKAEGKLRNDKFLQAILEYADEVPIEDILEKNQMMTGDLYSTRDNLERIIMFFGIIARYLSDYDGHLVNIAEMTETLRIRLHHGIKEELFDLVLRLNQVGRVRARILYDSGYHTADAVRKEKDPYKLHRKTGLGIKMCRKLLDKPNKKIHNLI